MNEVSLNGDSHINHSTIKQKALRINLNEYLRNICEIGAGQETVRQFFRVGGASGTIASNFCI